LLYNGAVNFHFATFAIKNVHQFRLQASLFYISSCHSDAVVSLTRLLSQINPIVFNAYIHLRNLSGRNNELTTLFCSILWSAFYFCTSLGHCFPPFLSTLILKPV